MTTLLCGCSRARLSADDITWLTTVDWNIWNRSRDRFGMTHAFPKREEALRTEDLARVLALVTTCQLPCVLGSGPYGGLSMAVYGHCESPGVRPDRLIVLDAVHVGLSGAHVDWNENFEWFEKYTHTSRNYDLCAFYKLPLPKERRHYEY